ncbi:hypothetical protein D3C85_1561730 [compost metagenome]
MCWSLDAGDDGPAVGVQQLSFSAPVPADHGQDAEPLFDGLPAGQSEAAACIYRVLCCGNREAGGICPIELFHKSIQAV